VNRRVTSDVEVRAVSGSILFDEFALPNNNFRDNAPSFYFGGTGVGRYWVPPVRDPVTNQIIVSGHWVNTNKVEVDAGLQYDGDDSDGLSGWVAFISVNKVQANPRILDNDKDWQPWRGTSRGYDLGFRITNAGTSRLTV